MIQKLPGNLKLLRQMRRQRFDAEGFSRVMAAIKNVHSKFFGQGEGPMRTFSSDERVDPFANRSFQFPARSSRDDPNPPANGGSARKEDRLATKHAG